MFHRFYALVVRFFCVDKKLDEVVGITSGSLSLTAAKNDPELCSVLEDMRGQWSNDEGKKQMSTPSSKIFVSQEVKNC